MIILSLDLSAKSTGYAYGPAGAAPKSSSRSFAGAAGEHGLAAGRFASWLWEVIAMRGARPDHIVVEAPLPLVASRSDSASESQLMMHGALHAIAGVQNIPVTSVGVRTVRKHVTGSGNAQKDPTCRMLITMGYLPKGCADLDRSDAVAVFVWAESHVARKVGALELRA